MYTFFDWFQVCEGCGGEAIEEYVCTRRLCYYETYLARQDKPVRTGVAHLYSKSLWSEPVNAHFQPGFAAYTFFIIAIRFLYTSKALSSNCLSGADAICASDLIST